MIRSKYVLFYKSPIKAAGRPAVRQNVYAQKMKIYKLKLAKYRIFLKIEVQLPLEFISFKAK